MLGVTGPNEYENNVNNNWYTNYIAKWCLEYTLTQLHKVRDGALEEYDRIKGICGLTEIELEQWGEIAAQMYFPYSDEHQIYLQQDGFLDKQLIPVSELQSDQRPINQKWSWESNPQVSLYQTSRMCFRDFISLKITSVLKNLNDIIISTNPLRYMNLHSHPVFTVFRPLNSERWIRPMPFI